MLKPIDFKNKKVIILGLGITGASAFNYLKKRGAKIIVVDDKNPQHIPAETLDLVQDCEAQFFGGEIPPDDLIRITDLLVVSPGIYPDHIIYKTAKEFGVEIKNDINLFLDEWNYSNKIIGITGSNGKSTIVSLLGYIMQRLGLPHKVAGNIGNSPLDLLVNEELNGKETIFLELSNYQLELFSEKYFVDIAVITNISNNHLNRHNGDIQEYAKAKTNILKDGYTSLIVEGDNQGIQEYVLPIVKPKELYKVSLSTKDYEATEPGIYCDNDANLIFKKDKDSREVLFNNVPNRKLLGRHNLCNIGEVLMICKLLGIEIANILDYIREFPGLSHRIQFVALHNGVKFFNDSKSTSPDSTLKAIEALTNIKNIILIAGGVSKVDHYQEWRKILLEHIKVLILLPGNASDQIVQEAQVEKSIRVNDMREAVTKAIESAQDGDVVLLSPGAGSQNLFKNFEERGNEFMKEVKTQTNNG